MAPSRPNLRYRDFMHAASARQWDECAVPAIDPDPKVVLRRATSSRLARGGVVNPTMTEPFPLWCIERARAAHDVASMRALREFYPGCAHGSAERPSVYGRRWILRLCGLERDGRPPILE